MFILIVFIHCIHLCVYMCVCVSKYICVNAHLCVFSIALSRSPREGELLGKP